MIENRERHRGHALRKGRISEPGRVYMITTVTENRVPLFADLFIARSIVRVLFETEATTLAYVIMRDHLHWLVELLNQNLSRTVQEMKSRSAIAVNRQLKRSGSVWQHGYHDHALRKGEDLRKAARYIIANPLRAKLVDEIGDYPFWDAVWL